MAIIATTVYKIYVNYSVQFKFRPYSSSSTESALHNISILGYPAEFQTHYVLRSQSHGSIIHSHLLNISKTLLCSMSAPHVKIVPLLDVHQLLMLSEGTLTYSEPRTSSLIICCYYYYYSTYV
jgi:hypothetical protein